MNIPKLNHKQEADLQLLLDIHKRQGNKALSSFWINYRYRTGNGEFSKNFKKYCKDMEIDLNSFSFEEISEEFQKYCK